MKVNKASAEERARIEHTVAVLNGDIPAVFVNGMGKSNPSAEEVAEVYRRTQ
jgi:hypothetical protein